MCINAPLPPYVVSVRDLAMLVDPPPTNRRYLSDRFSPKADSVQENVLQYWYFEFNILTLGDRFQPKLWAPKIRSPDSWKRPKFCSQKNKKQKNPENSGFRRRQGRKLHWRWRPRSCGQEVQPALQRADVEARRQVEHNYKSLLSGPGTIGLKTFLTAA